MRISLLKSSVAAAALTLAGTTASVAGAVSGARAVDLSQAVDQGSLAELGAADQTMSVTLSLGLRDQAGAEAMMVRVATPGDALYHQFMTPAQIRASFGPDESEVARAMSVLRLSGLTVERPTSTTLQVTGSVSTMERVFQTSLHRFSVPATETAPAATFHAAVAKPTMPAGIAGVVNGTIGLNNAPIFHSNLMFAPTSFGGKAVPATAGEASDGTPFGQLTVTDFANFYDVNPLYAKGINGAGRTIAVVTFAAFTQSDAQLYWDSLNLVTKPNRITVVNIDGGAGAPNDLLGSDETTLDVEQAGGIAPMADIILYEAPNTNQSFVDAFAKAAEDNIADSISDSFGSWELLNTAGNPFNTGTATDPFDGETVNTLQAVHEVFVLAALEGQSLFAAAGDDGAFDTVHDFFLDQFSNPLSVDYPGDDPAITSGGGTTLPGTLEFPLSATENFPITIPAERVWGWDYQAPFCEAVGLTVDQCFIFPIGTGGGVSVFFPVPATQIGLAGVQRSQPGQSFTTLTTPTTDFFDLPANFAGRNVPDVSFNADPETGQLLLYTSNFFGFEVLPGGGGTSFVAPQLNGVTALLGQNSGHRLGLFTVPLYLLARTGIATLGPHPALRTLTTGDNWFYTARNGYSPAGGLGTIDVAQLARLLP